ncbi:MAG TPA: peptide-methionine (S)-S-oxide reductase, partial [bacterium]|nr:peptide-methionine (S)-S-oxide reductase [bacterium]
MKKPLLLAFLLCSILSAGYALSTNQDARSADQPADRGTVEAENLKKATFAGGCFWCMEPPFEKRPGVISVTSGYTGGTQKSPTYREVSAGGTGHAESVEILYDSSKVSY